MLHDIMIQEIMTTPVETVHFQDPFHKVEEKLRLKDIRHLPVVDGKGMIMGLVTQRDFFRLATPQWDMEEGFRYSSKSLDDFVLNQVMIKKPITMSPEDKLSTAVKVMAEHKYGCIPVVDKNQKVAGIVTETDILKLLARHL